MDDETVIQAERIPAGPDAPPGRTLWGRPLHIVILVAILVAALLAESVLVFKGDSTERTQNDVLDVSRRFAALLTTYNSSTIERQRTQVLSLATGKFRDQYDELTGSAFQTTLKDRQADSKGAVVRIAVADVEGDNATVLAVVRVTTSNKDLKQPRVDTNLLEVALVKTSSGWRIDNVTILGTLT
jgi:Mce-associated membrane protein